MESGQTLSEHVGITKRERNRIHRTRVFLDTAIDDVPTASLDAHTMHRPADAPDTAIRTRYRYFPPTAPPPAEVQRNEEVIQAYIGRKGGVHHALEGRGR